MADVEITLTIPDEKKQAVMEGFLFLHPVPLTEADEDGNGGGEPTMSEEEWLKEGLRGRLVKEIARGLEAKAKAERDTTPDNSLVS